MPLFQLIFLAGLLRLRVVVLNPITFLCPSSAQKSVARCAAACARLFAALSVFVSEKKSKSCSASTAETGHDFRGANKRRDDPAVSHEEKESLKVRRRRRGAAHTGPDRLENLKNPRK